MADEKQAVEVKAKRERSPAFPFIPLEDAIQRLTALDTMFGRHPTPARKAGLAWDMKPESSQAAQTLAALKYFGLIEYEGSGDDRNAVLSADGRNFLRAQQESIRQDILKRCALNPDKIKVYYYQWGVDRPANPVALDELVLKGGFSESAARTFLNVYDKTMRFAGLSNSSKSEDNPPRHDDPKVKAGDYVEWESNGVLQFTPARRVESLSDDGKFAFVAGSATGLPIEELAVVAAPEETKGNPAPNPENKPPATVMPPIKPPAQGARQDVFSLDEGQVILQWPAQLSKESFEDFESWIELQLRKIKRSIQ